MKAPLVDPNHAMYQEPRRARTTEPRPVARGDFEGSFAEKCEWMRQKQKNKKDKPLAASSSKARARSAR
jgi:hypothetical protein